MNKAMRVFILLTAITLIVTSGGIAQNLPAHLTDKEKALLPYYTPQQSRGITTPPASPIRNVAEWEEMDAVLIAIPYYEDFLTEVIRYTVDECLVYLYVDDSIEVNNMLIGAGVDVTNVRYLQEYVNSVWIRDYGANSVYTNDVDSLLLVDWIYNRPRPEDDASPAAFASVFDVPLYEITSPPTDLVHTGGNFMSDGFGTAFSEKIILDENAEVDQYNQTPKTEQDIDNIMNDFLGIDNYIKIENLPYDGIHHIDMHMKILDEETLLVGYYPDGISDGPYIEDNLNYILNNFNSVYGTPYEVVRIPMPPSQSGTWPDDNAYYRTYTNSLIINNSVLIPTYYEEYDTTALRIYKEAMPGYRVIGIDANEVIPASGTIHCTTHEVATKDPLLISHQRLRDQTAYLTEYTIDAKIMHRSGISNASIYYKNSYNGSYSAVGMSLSNPSENIWTGNIPGMNPGDSVYYYIEATSVSGKTQNRPMPAPEAYWAFKVLNSTSVTSNNLDNFKINVLYPHIESTTITSEIVCSKETNIKLDLYNAMGQHIQKIHNGKLPKGRALFYIKTNELSSGVYIIKGINNNNNQTAKFVIR
ncbi:MAG: hypothetical protein C0594_01420, partial [Marinilabiliales bacterium]